MKITKVVAFFLLASITTASPSLEIPAGPEPTPIIVGTLQDDGFIALVETAFETMNFQTRDNTESAENGTIEKPENCEHYQVAITIVTSPLSDPNQSDAYTKLFAYSKHHGPLAFEARLNRITSRTIAFYSSATDGPDLFKLRFNTDGHLEPCKVMVNIVASWV